MADKVLQNEEMGDTAEDSPVEEPETPSNLESFVTDHYQRQKEEGKLDSTDELSDERTNDFFKRALGESRRMNTEVVKSNKKLDKLHSEFGLKMVNQWQTEHASEVLQPHEHDLIKQAQYQNPTATP